MPKILQYHAPELLPGQWQIGGGEPRTVEDVGLCV